jgi:hypothetical protein
VNAARGHFEMGVHDLAQAHSRWSTHVAGLITQSHSPSEFAQSVDHHQPESIKEVVEWAK